ncbi:MAG: hypothetical protein PHS96_06105 [Anaerolineales bacterium]|nr:hypothetical protein [Anaerolineales bacterium]
MKTAANKLIGITLMVSAIAGVLICLAGLIAIWGNVARVQEAALAQLDLAIAVLDTTGEALELAYNTILTTGESVATIEATVGTLALSIQESTPLLDSLTALVGENLPNALASTQTSLTAAQSSASVIDNVLRVVTLIPFFPGDPYNPEVPLSDALGEVAASLEGLPESLDEMQGSLESSQDNMMVMQANLEVIAEDIGAINASLEEAAPVVARYQEVVAEVKTNMESAQNRLPVWLNRLAWLLTIFFGWLGFTQIGLFTQGLEMTQKGKAQD